MATEIKYRRGTAAQNDVFTGALGEITVDSDTGRLRTYDGATAGGHKHALTDTANTWASVQDFSAAGAYFGGSAPANLLDDYEEGTWTPSLQDDSLSDSEGQTYAHQVGTYTKIGGTVYIQANIHMSGLGTLTASEGARIGGLPFASSSVANTHHAIDSGYGASLNITAGTSLSGYIAPGATAIIVASWDSASGITATLISEITSNGHVIMSGYYKV